MACKKSPGTRGQLPGFFFWGESGGRLGTLEIFPILNQNITILDNIFRRNITIYGKKIYD